MIALLHRHGDGRPWVEVGRAPSLREALKLIAGSGDWWLSEHGRHEEEVSLGAKTAMRNGRGLFAGTDRERIR
jgi:hypothetical protein